MRPRTKRQRQILDAISSFTESNGHEPSYSDIASELGIRSKSGIAKHIEALEIQGHLTRKRENGRFRLEIHPQKLYEELVYQLDWLSLPDFASELIPNYELYVPKFMTGIMEPEKLRGFVVPNDAMIGEHIREGDVALIEKRTFARDSEFVVASIRDVEEVIIRTYQRSGSQIDFVPSNELYDTLTYSPDDVKILGIYRGLIRPAI